MKKYDVMQKALATLKDYPDGGKVIGLKKLLSQPIENGKENKQYYLLGEADGAALNEEAGKIPHTLIGGSSGSGKSMLLNNIILSLAIRYSPEQAQFLLIDPKMVEFGDYVGLPHLLGGQPLRETKDIFDALEGALDEMNYRYTLLEQASKWNIETYNEYATAAGLPILPRIFIIVDEFADLMAVDKNRTQNYILHLAQKSRAAGISLILSSQRTGADAIAGHIKANFAARIACRTSTVYDSRKILDQGGAEKLTECGQFLYKTAIMTSAKLGKSAGVSYAEIRDIVAMIETEWKS